MSEESTGLSETTVEQVEVDSTEQSTDTLESSSVEQSVTSDQGTTTTDSTSSDDSFFNYDEIKDNPELVKAYKQMQGQFTKQMQMVRENQQKITAYDNFRADPVGNLQQMAQQLGFSLSKGEAQRLASEHQENFEPESWDQVFAAQDKRTEAMLEKMFNDRFGPVVNQVTEMKRDSIEKFLDDNAPDWRQYESQMAATLKNHPTLASDPIKLYELAIPSEVRESRAYKKALGKMQGKVSSGQASGISQTKQSEPSLEAAPAAGSSFDDVVQWAKKVNAKRAA